ncbi:MAG: shikimate kinase [Lachnospiraceae bacterium]|nr:shikimate kinase [Lachnospira sp.]MBR6697086.1 shikimate kinase [Lachnospiraceae bacterium]
MDKSVILIGMPGVGKSTVGVVLAKRLGYNFVDADIVIQKREGRLLKDIIATDGINTFIEIENAANLSIELSKNVIATGGSAIYCKEAMERYFENAIVVYLKIDMEELLVRLGSLDERGVVIKDGQTFEKLYEERCALYEKYAHVTLEVKGLSLRETAEKLDKIIDTFRL